MNGKQSNKLNSYLAVKAVLAGTDVWESLPAFPAGAEELDELIANIRSENQTQTIQKGAAAEKAQAFMLLVDAAYEAAAATRARAVASSNKELGKRVDYSRSDVGKGRNTSVVARCQDILSAATQNVSSLGNYGMNQAKLSALQKRIDIFQVVQAKPRQGKALSSSATKELAKLFRRTDELLNDQLDALAVQFKETHPAFYNAYKAARVIVDRPAGFVRARKAASISKAA
jgi:hypothetical protein